MTSRYVIGSVDRSLREELARYHWIEPPRDVSPNFNAAPRQMLPVVILGDDGRRRPVSMRWVLIPRREQDAEHGRFRPTNARAETFRTLPALRHLAERHRGLVPASGFLEWDGRRKGQHPVLCRLRHRTLFSPAGLWDAWRGRGPNAAAPRSSFPILTTEPNPLVAPLHDRMPLVRQREDEAAWLDPGTDPAHLEGLTRPYAPEAMIRYPVSRSINLARNNAPELLEPVAEGGA